MGTVSLSGIAFQRDLTLSDLRLALALAQEDFRVASLFGGTLPFSPETTVETLRTRIKALASQISVLEQASIPKPAPVKSKRAA